MKKPKLNKKTGCIRFDDRDDYVCPNSQDHMIVINGEEHYLMDRTVAKLIEALRLSRKEFARLNMKEFGPSGGGWK